ncbi:replicative DNA helicase [Mycoplasmopsis caviae]|uniref:Replicative DNA helicase n=1 Tax=Mycoplasmopsis caviae TaxID=55603 RepID=A0A3P8LBN7_9BACT|nr:replicative DNA helicase [Mycoplasmopsis caviae]UUD35555.1 replicative DNA helicase [Mycoplasmopsis caviae]VDR41672.1 Replicative DNA helicase [Mycoplasmopsis caviae]VDR42591.1 Replicative DNA helicase [Mycoplasmopsis caviae]
MQNNNLNNKPINSSRHINAKYEESLLGLILTNNKNASKIVPYLLEEDFAILENQRLFSIFKELFENNISINEENIFITAEKRNYVQITPHYLARLYHATGFSSNIQTYLEELVKLTKLRLIESRVALVQRKLDTEKNINEKDVIFDLQNLLLDIDRSQVSAEFLTAKEVSDEYYKDLETRHSKDLNELNGLSTGYSNIDQVTQGLHGGELIIIAARPAMGKTAFALNIASNVVKRENKRAVFFTLEMSSTQLMGRIYSLNTQVPLQKLKQPQAITQNEFMIINSIKQSVIDKMNLFIDESVNNELNTLLWKCRRLHKVSPIDIIVIDYLQLISSDTNKRGDSRQNEIAKISRSLKTLALELNIPVIALSQLSREVEKREDKRPIMSDLRESGNIEQDADIVMFLYRENYYKKNVSQETKDLYGDIGEKIDIIIAKHRNGPTGTFPLWFKMSCGYFMDFQNEDIAISIEDESDEE